MKRSSLFRIPLVASLCSLALPVKAVVIVDDTWLDGSRSEQNLPTESQWFNAGTGATLTPSVGSLLMGIPVGSASWETYFAAEGTPVTLASVGDNLTVRWVFTTGTIGANNTSQNFRLALVDSPAAARVNSDVAPGSDVYAGYAMFMNMGATLGNANPYRLMERDGSSAALLSASTPPWNGLANGATTGNHGYDNNTQYILTLSLTRNAANGLDIISTMAGGTLNNSGTATLSFTDPTPNSFTYDTFALRPSGSNSTADSFLTTQFRVDFNQVPEPSTFALVGLGAFGLSSLYRRRSSR